MSNRTMNVGATIIALALAGTAVGQTQTGPDPAATTPPPVVTVTSSPGQARVADKFSAPFVTMAGSRENATILANALRTGSPATLTYTSVAADGTTTTTTTTITPPTKPMGWGNVKHSLALAQFALTRAGVTNPTGAQLQAALEGGSFTTAEGKTVTFAGVLQQRADGLGFGQIAKSYGTTMGAVNRGIKAPPTTVATTTAPPSPKTDIATKTTNSDVGAARGVTTAGGTSAQVGQRAKGITTTSGASAGAGQGKGLTTAGGTPAAAGHGSKGITTATGASSGAKAGGIVSADAGPRGNGNALGRGVVTAAGGASVASAAGIKTGGSSGIVTGTAGASGVATADPGNSGGSAKSNGKGKGGG